MCRSLFTETLGIYFSQVRTVLQKVNTLGILEGEKRGGRQQIETDNLLKEQVTKHIDKFPRMESHYCRANSNCQYLSPDLNFEIMYKMYKREHPNGASLTLYKNVVKSLNLKFHHAKKDLCGLCDTFHRSADDEKKNLQERFHRHITEKEKSRELKTAAKLRASTDNTFRAAVFDLE